MNSITVSAWHYYNDMCRKFSVESDMSFKTFAKECNIYLETMKEFDDYEKADELDILEGMVFDWVLSKATFDME